MLRPMQTIPPTEHAEDLTSGWADGLVHAAFEACVTFSGTGDGSPVCASCGWLDTDHTPSVALVRSLPRQDRNRVVRPPKRLAS
jgi:hypothetical protein